MEFICGRCIHIESCLVPRCTGYMEQCKYFKEKPKHTQEQTNEEFLRDCSTDELVSEILSLVDGGILDSWHEEHKEIDEWDDKGVVELWLKEKHNGKK